MIEVEGKGTSMATKAQVVKAAERIGITLEDDGDHISVYFDSGKHDGSGCHELVTEVARFASKALAWDAVLEDINILWIDCNITDCEWCG